MPYFKIRSAFDVFKQTLNSLCIICFYSQSNVCPKYYSNRPQNSVQVQYVVLGPRNSAMPLVRAFSENDKIFRREKKNTLNNKGYRDLLISILSYGEVSTFLLWVKTRN